MKLRFFLHQTCRDRKNLPYSGRDSVSPLLKSLVLDSVKFSDGKPGCQAILTAFPNLQDLMIHEAKGWYYWDGSVSSPTLKRFVYRRDDDTSRPKPCVTFDTPGLVYLEYSDMVADNYENLCLAAVIKEDYEYAEDYYGLGGSSSVPSEEPEAEPKVTDTVGASFIEVDDEMLEALPKTEPIASEEIKVTAADSLVEARLDLLLTADQIMRKSAPDNVGFVPGDVSVLFKGIRNDDDPTLAGQDAYSRCKG